MLGYDKFQKRLHKTDRYRYITLCRSIQQCSRHHESYVACVDGTSKDTFRIKHRLRVLDTNALFIFSNLHDSNHSAVT